MYSSIVALALHWSYVYGLVVTLAAALGGGALAREFLPLLRRVAFRRLMSPVSAQLMVIAGAVVGSVYIGRIKATIQRITDRVKQGWEFLYRSFIACPFMLRATIAMLIVGAFVAIGWVLVGLAVLVPALVGVVLRNILLYGLDKIVVKIVQPLFMRLQEFARTRGLTKHEYVLATRRREAQLLWWLRRMRVKLLGIRKK